VIVREVSTPFAIPGSAPGVWTTNDVYEQVKAGNWPEPI
jgi:hypothetical protein